MKYTYYSILIISFIIVGLHQSLKGKMKDEVGEEITEYFLGQIKIIKLFQILSLIAPLIILLLNEKWYWALLKYIVLYYLIVLLTIINTLKTSNKSKMYLIIILGLTNILLLITYINN